ncbi:MAG: ATP-binding protein [Christensenellaceae bacterium]
MKKKLIIYNVVLSVVVMLLMFWFSIGVTNNNYAEISEKKIKAITEVYVANYSENLSFPDNDNDVRVTVIDATGKVLADSRQISEENHIYREEIISAANGTPKAVIRKSDTLNREMMYYAEKVETGDSFVFIRVAIPTESINSYALKSIAPMLAILLVVWVLSIIVSIALSGVLLKPLKQVKDGLGGIENGVYNEILPTTDDKDVNEILSGINDLSEKLQRNITDTRNEKQKLDYVLANVTDGIAVFDRDLNIVIANKSLSGIFGVNDAVGKRIEVLTVDKSFTQAVGDCAQNKQDSIFQFKVNERWYLCTVRFTDLELIIAVLCDVTQTKENEKMRFEFFANASHELKTPLTTVKGFNDMVLLNSKDDSVTDYALRINKELDRVLKLISDMLDLSKLENSTVALNNLSKIQLQDVASDVAKSLEVLCSQKGVTIEVSGDSTICAEYEHIYELIKNLAENGVRYNNAGGKVTIGISDENGKVKLEVSDNGIGIDLKDQDRIFERFYRVNKSRSRTTGGTGLGLSIVKHICRLYNAEITLKSKLASGTTVTVTFDKPKS